MLLFLCITAAFGLPMQFPGYVGPPLDADSGYLGNLFYVHIAATLNPESAPLAFWFQGGPGSSSMFGLFTENGPINVLNASHVEYRDINWLQFFNMVWMDSPACVGFSKGDAVTCNTSDTESAVQNYEAIKMFVSETMPQYLNRSFYLTGESYAGAYIPMVSLEILKDVEIAKNLAGFLIGNPVMFCATNRSLVSDGTVWAQFNSLYWRGMISQNVYEDWRANDCDSEAHRLGKYVKECASIFFSALQIELDDNLFVGDEFLDFCTGNNSLSFALSKCGAFNETSPPPVIIV